MVKGKKRLYLHYVIEHDRKKNESNVRLIEMIIDNITSFDGYCMQFFKDFQTYGLYEAILYLQNSYTGNFDELETIYNRLVQELQISSTPPNKNRRFGLSINN